MATYAGVFCTTDSDAPGSATSTSETRVERPDDPAMTLHALSVCALIFTLSPTLSCNMPLPLLPLNSADAADPGAADPHDPVSCLTPLT